MENSKQFSELFLDFNSEKKLRNNADGLKDYHAQSLWTKLCSTLSRNDISEISNVRFFAENLTYVHGELNSSEYFLHPLRVGALAGLLSPQEKVLGTTVGILHNVYEVTSVSQIDIMKNFGASVSDAVLKLTISRKLQSNNTYLKEYYSEINNLPFNLGMIKVLDKIDNLYYQHKLSIENYIKKNCINYKIYRIPQILGYSGNNDNLVNYFVNKIKKNEEISLYKNVKRSILDVDDLKKIVDINLTNSKNETLNISSIEKISVINLCKKIGDILNIRPKIKIIVVTTKLNWNTRNSKKINEIINSLDLVKKNYTNNTLIKYIKK